MGYQPKTDILLAKRSLYVIHYCFVLIAEILKANIVVFKMIYSSKYELEPAVVHFKADLHSQFARVLLANSITLTPGTITVALDGDEYTVHCLDKELAVGLDSSIFVQLLERIERVN
jgi:multicomponent Na+:H+ antiporter subunit E